MDYDNEDADTNVNGAVPVDDIDIISSSSDDDDEEIEKTVGVGEGVSTADQYKEILEQEEEEFEKISSVLLEDTAVEKRFQKYDELVSYVFKKTHYQDITPMFVDGTPVLIDGTSLLTCVLEDDNYNRSNGGQTLHFVYLSERIIELISRKGGTCHIVFFQDKSLVFEDIPEFMLALLILKIHLKKNTSIVVHEMDSIFSSEFTNYVEEVHPCFMILDFGGTETFKELLPNEKADPVEKLFNYSQLFVMSIGLYCVDIRYIALFNNLLHSFVTSMYMKDLYKNMQQDFVEFSSRNFNQVSIGKLENFCDFRSSSKRVLNVKRCIAVQTAKILSESGSIFFIDNNELVKIYLLYSALLECLPLSCRALITETDYSDELSSIIQKIQVSVCSCLKNENIFHFDCSLISDLWHGNLFIQTVQYASNLSIFVGKKLGSVFDEFIELFNLVSGQTLSNDLAFSNRFKKKLREAFKSVDQTDAVQPKVLFEKDLHKPLSDSNKLQITESNEVMQPLNDMIKEFCSDIMSAYYTCNLFDYFKDIIKTNKVFEENFHWHCMKPLTDNYDRIKDTNKENADLPMRKQLRLKAQYAHYMALYGSNIEGKPLEHEPIVVCEGGPKGPVSKKKQKKQNESSSSKKALEIIEKNKMKKQKELLDKEKQKFDTFLIVYKTNKTGRLGDSKNLELINQTMLNISSDEYSGKMLYYKTEVLYQLWLDESNKGKNNSGPALEHFKELFLSVKQLLKCVKKNKSLLIDKQSQKLGKILCFIGFKTIAEKWNLPLSNDTEKSLSNSPISYIRFQLTHLGPELERRVEGQYDDRVSGFIPDPWQRKLFDIVDDGQSALIVAPTSSGKTYASYYCMKKVLKESNEGRVVYVAPTKALVNQVAATIYARFKNKNMPAGMSVYGVFTRDYKHNATDCQILVTVPECLELLLMSPRRYTWTKSLKYVIFDEVHCLAGQGGGIAWERCLMLIPCPFLALSATVQNPREFWAWMVSIENFKKSLDPRTGTKVHLVTHTDRHNDLVRYIYGKDNSLHHIHPFAHLTNHILSAHNGIPPHLSLAPKETLQLFDVMKSVCPNDISLSELDPDLYFKNTETGFLYRQDVKEYEKKLRSILEKWFVEKRKLFTETIKRLYEPLKYHEGGTKNFFYFKDKIIPFVENLRSKNMLPALIFSYNRLYCEVIADELAKHYVKKEDEYVSQKKKPLFQIQNYDDRDDDYDEEERSKGKKRPTAGKKEERRKRDVAELFPVGLTKCFIEFSLRGKYRIDNKDLQFIERRLSKKFNKKHVQINQLRRGLGVHHGGIITVLRQSVEMLFRSKFLNVVFATGTLALGIHMPCKTVVIMGDSPFLNTLEYHQMSGRSGRRGFDKTGDVIFFGLDTDKMRVLMTSKLPRMTGNFPLSVSTVLRLLLLMNDITEKNKKTEESKKAALHKVLTVLNEGLLYQTEKKLKDQMKHFVLFSCQLLMIQRLIDSSCQPTMMAGLATHLHYHEPGNLAFVNLLRSGVLAKLCQFSPDGRVSQTACENVVKLLCVLFTRLPLITKDGEIYKREYQNSLVELPPLPAFVTKALKRYNEEVETVYRRYFEGFSDHINETMGEDNSLPISGKVFEGSCNINELCVKDENETATIEMIFAGKSNRNKVCSAFSGLSGQTDDNLYCQNSLISNIRHQVFTDCKIIPVIDLETPLNGYAYDFYKHGILRSIMEDNGLKSGHDYVYLLDFLLVIKTIETSLYEIGMTVKGVSIDNELDKNNLNRCVSDTFRQVRFNFESFFNKAYNIQEKF